jgi:hypothetical protein
MQLRQAHAQNPISDSTSRVLLLIIVILLGVTTVDLLNHLL